MTLKIYLDQEKTDLVFHYNENVIYDLNDTYNNLLQEVIEGSFEMTYLKKGIKYKLKINEPLLTDRMESFKKFLEEFYKLTVIWNKENKGTE